MNKPLWIYRPLLNTTDVVDWARAVGVKKIMPPDTLHTTILTVHTPCDWSKVKLNEDEIVVPAGIKTMQVFGWTIKALCFGSPEISARHAELATAFPDLEHPILRPHVSLYRGGRMIHDEYRGELRFGPERLKELDLREGRMIKHVRITDI